MHKKYLLLLASIVIATGSFGFLTNFNLSIAEEGTAVAKPEVAEKTETPKPNATSNGLPPEIPALDTFCGPLCDYLNNKDDSYAWKKIREGKIADTEYVELILTSQTWRGITWKHQLFIAKPSTLKANTTHALLFIEGGLWSDKIEDPKFKQELPRQAMMLAALAEKLGTPIAVLLDVPQQPIFNNLVEDQIIAYTFDKFLKTGDADWPLLLPMAKSAVKAMDATQEFCKKDWAMDIKTFTVTGASKRGWTTWLVGACDKRATMLAPMVIDTLNMIPQMAHQIKSWGKFSERIHDYTSLGIMQYLTAARGQELTGIVDPFVYRKLLTQPKLIIIGTNDRYWPLDALNLYWDGLVGPKYILYVPNNGHGIRDVARLMGNLFAINEAARGGAALPDLKWEFDENGDGMNLQIESDKKPKRVQIWQSKSKTRDFREAKWFPVEAKADGEKFKHAEGNPESGFSAFFGEAVYDLDGTEFYLSTNVRILEAKPALSE